MRAIAYLAAASVVTAASLSAQAGPRQAHVKLFPPDQLGLLEAPDRDEWQQPDRIMDALGIAEGSRVADLGAGGGWFTIRLAERVGPNGTVYAEDIQLKMIELIDRRISREGRRNVQTILGTPTDTRLNPPGNLDAVIMVDTYPQIGEPLQVLKSIAMALAPKGKLGIVDFRPDGTGGPGPDLAELVRAGQADVRQERLLPIAHRQHAVGCVRANEKISCCGRVGIKFIHIHAHPQPDVPEIHAALGAERGALGLRERRQEQARENGDDGDDDEKLD